jgi:hypothetical protein
MNNKLNMNIMKTIAITKEELKVLIYSLQYAAEGACSNAEQDVYEKLESELIERFFTQS